jgi:hypothetical protein
MSANTRRQPTGDSDLPSDSGQAAPPPGKTLAHARDSAGLDRLPSTVRLREVRHRADRVAGNGRLPAVRRTG